jgi:(1->4)-alpha-D-glucan 1-alpha-D-glucosylmutase
MESPSDATDDERNAREAFVLRFQQTTGPVQAKGLEDTSFYRQAPLLSLNEVGGDPTRFGGSVPSFHALNASRLADWSGGLSTTATHDAKRGEDARIRINVISELTDEWRTRLARWSRWNSRKRATLDDRECPDAREEYTLYQTLLGAWPFEDRDRPSDEFVERVQGYVVKAACEAKRNTTWTDPDPAYRDALQRFVADVLRGPDAPPFLDDFLPFQRRVAKVGVVHSLAQTLLKLISPGAADVYQGCELWDFSLVDPDNRRPVDFAVRTGMLDEIRRSLASGASRADVAAERLRAPEDGAIKLYLIWTALTDRRRRPTLYLKGAYRPIETAGETREHVVAVLRSCQGAHALAVAPRLVAGWMGDDGSKPPIGDVWADAELILPDFTPGRWRDLLTDRVVEARVRGDLRVIGVAEAFQTLPVALLVADGADAHPS